MRVVASFAPLFAFIGLSSCGGPSSSPSGSGASGGASNGATGGASAAAGTGNAPGGASGDAGSGGSAGSVASGGSGATAGAGGAGGTGATGGDATSGGAGPAAGTGGTTSGGDGGLGAGGTPDAGAGGEATGGSGGMAPFCSTSTLREAAACTNRLVGAALSTAHLGESAYAEAAKEFSYVTAENEMKWIHTEATRNSFTFGPGDAVVDFADDNGMKVKGHTLVWYNQLPSWVSDLTDADELRSVMTNHITQVMQHYQGKVIAWDVVNEAWDPQDPTVLRDTVFSRVLGPSYIDDAFKAARAADPDAKLYYNDYGADGLSTKSNSIYEMVKDMKARDIPIDGVGLQMHWRAVGSSLTAADVAANIQRLGELGLEVVISEMDVQICKGGTLDEQKVRFHDMVAACVSQPSCAAVTFWGINDKYSWLNDLDLGCTAGETPSGLLWDDDYAKKPAYLGVKDAFEGR